MTTANHPVHELMDEHRLIEKVLATLEDRLARLDGEPFPAEFFEKALDFFANFADGCHHYKEEDALFPRLKMRGVPEQGGPIGCMLKEHNLGRSYLAGVRSNLPAAREGSPEAVAAIRQQAGDYIDMLRQHIVKEDTVLFRLAQYALEPDDVEALRRDWARQDNPRIGPAVRARYEALAAELAGVSAAVAVG